MWWSCVYACLLIGMGFKVHIAAPLVCYTCHANQHCKDLETTQGRGFPCFDNEVCKKDIVRDQEKRNGSVIITSELISRGCVTYDPSKDILNQCVAKWRINDQEYLRCLCNDTNYCNGGHALHDRRSRIPAKMQMVGLTVTALIINRAL